MVAKSQLLSCAALALALAACSFDGVDPGGTDGGNRDGGDRPDGSGLDGGAVSCADWAPRAFFTACDHPEFEGTTPVPIDIDEAVVFDTGDLSFTPEGITLRQFTATMGGSDVVVWYATDVSITSTLRVVGSRPLVIASLGQIEVTGGGSIDIGSAWRIDETLQDDGVFEFGGGANPTGCFATHDGSDGDEGGGGGAGGTFRSQGGAGGTGEDPNGFGGVPDNTVVALSSLTLRGGCRGGDGGDGPGDAVGGPGGPGGGALLLTSLDTIRIDGSLLSGGSTGIGQLVANRSGGGGGGSGGLLALEAPVVEFGTSAVLAANGGGGGGGANGRIMENDPNRDLLGQSGQPTMAAALGALGEGARFGGAGAAFDVVLLPAEFGGPIVTDRGAGGGGGGIGFILAIVPSTADVIGAPLIESPSLQAVGPDLVLH